MAESLYEVLAVMRVASPQLAGFADRIAVALLPSAADEPVALAWENPMHSAIVESAIRSGAGKLDGTFQPATGDPNEGHADSCACLRPGDRDCNCHKAHGFDTAEAMEDDDAKAKARAQADAASAWRLVIDAAMASPAWPSTSGPNIDRVLAIIGESRPPSARPSAGVDPWTPSDADYDRSIHTNPDAAAWADFFVATFPGQAAHRDLMLGWFANAMMAQAAHMKAHPVAPAAEGWQPIETAPKDGTTRLLFCEEDGERFIGLRPLDCPDDAAADLLGIACYPTHWRPLPAAPSPAQPGAK